MKKIGIITITVLMTLIGRMNVQAEVYTGNDVVNPIGTVKAYSGTTVPKGYLMADGSAISRTEYKELFQLIATTYGEGNGSTTFNIPNLMERVIVGQSNNDSFKYLGKTGGEANHTLTEAELPSHTHTFTGDKHKHTFAGTAVTSGNNSATPTASFTGRSVSTSSAGAHTHNVKGYGAVLGSGSTGWRFGSGGSKTGTGLIISAGAHTHTVTASGTVSLANTTHTHSFTAAGTISEEVVTGTNSNAGGGQAHNNMQPYIVLKYIIRAK